MRHEVVICKNKNKPHCEVARAADQEEEEYLFSATCFSSIESCQNWLIGSTNHMTNNKKLSNSSTLKVQVGDDKYIVVNGKRCNNLNQQKYKINF